MARYELFAAPRASGKLRLGKRLQDGALELAPVEGLAQERQPAETGGQPLRTEARGQNHRHMPRKQHLGYREDQTALYVDVEKRPIQRRPLSQFQHPVETPFRPDHDATEQAQLRLDVDRDQGFVLDHQDAHAVEEGHVYTANRSSRLVPREVSQLKVASACRASWSIRRRPE